MKCQGVRRSPLDKGAEFHLRGRDSIPIYTFERMRLERL